MFSQVCPKTKIKNTFFIADNRRKQKRKEVQSKPNYLDFIRYGFNNAELTENSDRLCISPQLALAALRFLASCKYMLSTLAQTILINLCLFV